MTDPNRPRGKPLLVGLALAVAVSVSWTGYSFMVKPGIATVARGSPSPAAMRIDERNQQLVLMGEPLYAANCASCHGADMEGQADWQRRLPNGRLPAPPHDETGHTWHHPDDTLFDIVKYGTAALLSVDYDTDMDGYEDILTDAEIRAVLAYIKSRWPDNIRDRHRQMTESARQ